MVVMKATVTNLEEAVLFFSKKNATDISNKLYEVPW